jgi:RNA polymerase sigma factor (sigma-70 family)
MDQEPLRSLLRSLRRLVEPTGGAATSDAELLERFATRRDHAAFEVLLWRHGPMVLGACRRLLPNAADAEDAFQATWLILVRKAGTVTRGEALGGWLHRVACRVALRLRAGQRRGGRELPDPERVAGPVENGAGDDLRRVLDEELSQLPTRHRAAFVLCCLEGKTGAEAARELGCAPGTVSSRLTRAREQLRRRLTRRGLAPAAGGVTATFAGEAWAAPVSEALIHSTLETARAFAAGTTPAALCGPAVSLADGVLGAMSLSKLQVVLALMLLLGTLGTGAALARRVLEAAPGDPASRGTPEAVNAAQAKAQTPGASQTAQGRPGSPVRQRSSERIIRLLQDEIDLHKVSEVSLKLKDVFELLSDKLSAKAGRDVVILVNDQAFRAMNPDYSLRQIFGEEVEFPAFPRKISIETALRIALSKITTGNGTYLVRAGLLEVTTFEEASPAGLLRRKVLATFQQEPLNDALRELAEQTGASIVLDVAHAGDKATSQVTATFRHDTSLKGALEILTALAGLKLVVLEDGGLFVTTSQVAQGMQRDQGLCGNPKGTSPPPPSPK